MIDVKHSVAIIVVVTLVTLALRWLPFLVFAKGTPKPVVYLGKVLPYALIAMLVIYCLKNLSFVESPHGIPELISVAVVAALHKWRHRTLLSIIVGTVCYMLLIQFVFV
ncbi:MAG: AzlD domain-containing protein [Oscillospiraceae bacterium]|nr:AzlD domain-containing protein [Oscillospiraceae bacterium]